MVDSVLYNNGLASIPAAQLQVTPAGGVSGSISSFLNGGTLLPVLAPQNAITASTTQTLAGATQLTGALCVIGTVANVGDAVRLAPAGVANVGQAQVVIQNGASAASIFPFETATAIDSHSTAAAATLTNGHRALFYQNTASTWVSFAGVSAAS